MLSYCGTWLHFKNKAGLRMLVEGDKRLFNQYGVMLVNPAKHPNVKKELGQAFIDCVVSPEGQQAIADYKSTASSCSTLTPTSPARKAFWRGHFRCRKGPNCAISHSPPGFKSANLGCTETGFEGACRRRDFIRLSVAWRCGRCRYGAAAGDAGDRLPRHRLARPECPSPCRIP